MADEMTPGEIRRTLERMEREHREDQRATDDRITKLAADMVPTTLWASEHRALKDDVDEVKTDLKDLREARAKRSLNAWQITVSIIAALAAVALVVEGVLQSGGH